MSFSKKEITGLVVIGVFIGLFTSFGVKNSMDTSNNHTRFNAWAQRCRNDGGNLYLYSVGSDANRYECYKNGKIIDHEE